MFEMIKKVNKNDVDDHFAMAQAHYDHDPSMEFDARGRLKRWVKVRQNSEEQKTKCCKPVLNDVEENLKFIDRLDKF